MNKKYDVTKSKRSIAGKLEEFIGRMNALGVDQIKEEFLNIVKDPDTQASQEVRTKWIAQVAKNNNKNSVMMTITNLYLAAARLSVK